MSIATDSANRGGTGGIAASGPDPTEASQSMILREVSALKELMELRAAAMQRAIDVAHDDLVRVPTDVQKAVGGLKELIHAEFNVIRETFRVQDEKFNGIPAAIRRARYTH